MSGGGRLFGKSTLTGLLPENYGRPFPRGARVRQIFPGPELTDVRAEVREQLSKPAVAGRLRPGMRVALGVGSRGISRLPELVTETVEFLRDRGAEPFIVPAMGSHGGATAEGQTELLAGYGVTSERVGAPVDSSMEVTSLGRTARGVEVWFSRAALEADAVLPLCRIKPHTAYRGPYESGVMKMLAIGFGKHRGAAALHAQGFDRFAEGIPEAGRMVLRKVDLLCALAVVENAQERPALVEALISEAVEEREPQLLEKARRWMGRILFDPVDLLVVDEIGKDVSGDGMDPNVTGRFSQSFIPAEIRVQKIVVLDLTEGTHGNACGIGAADVTTQKLFERLDFRQTYTNAITSTVLTIARLPVVMPDAESAIALGLGACNRVSPAEARVVRIKNTLELERIWVSEALLKESQGRDDVEVLEEAPLYPS